MRRSPRHEPLGPGYRHADLMAAWPRNRCGTGCHHTPQQLAVTIITIEEVLGEWYTQVRRAREDQQLARAYKALQQTIEFIRGIQLLSFDLPGIRRFGITKPAIRDDHVRYIYARMALPSPILSSARRIGLERVGDDL